MIVPSGKNNLGVSGRPIEHNPHQLQQDTIANELALLMLGDFEPLGIKIDLDLYRHEMKQFQNDWVPYLPRDDRSNNRYALSFYTLQGYDHKSVPSLAEVRLKENRKVSEIEMNHPTSMVEKVTSVHPLFNLFEDLGRTFVVRCDKGGYFVPHRDHPQIVRDSFRVICFLNNVGPYDYDWLMGEKRMTIEPGRCYYVNTRKVHRTISWKDNSQHLILNVPMNTWNVATVIGNMLHGH